MPRGKITPPEGLTLLLSFCNLKQLNVETLLEFHRSNRIGLSRGDFWLGPEEVFCRVRANANHVYCLTTGEFAQERRDESPDRYLIPSDSAFEALWPLLQTSQDRYRRFLKETIEKERLEPDFLKGAVSVLEKVKWSFVESSDPWRPHIMSDLGYSIHVRRDGVEEQPSLENHIDLEIAETLLRGRGELFEAVMLCPHCDKFFLKSRKDKTFCSDFCRRDYHNQRYTKQGYFRDKMREYRAEE